MKNKDVMIVTGAGQISMAIARRIGFGKKIVMGDKNINNAKAIAEIMNNAGFDVEPVEMDLSSRESILKLIAKAQEYGEIKMLVNGAGVSPSQAPVEAILKVDLYGTAVLLEEVGKVIAEGGAPVHSDIAHRFGTAGHCGPGNPFIKFPADALPELLLLHPLLGRLRSGKVHKETVALLQFRPNLKQQQNDNHHKMENRRDIQPGLVLHIQTPHIGNPP